MLEQYLDKQHSMIDIESLGKTPGSIIVSIGIFNFYLVRKIDGLIDILATETLRIDIDIQDSIDWGLTIDWDTLKEFWIDKVGIQHLVNLNSDTVNLEEGLNRLHSFTKGSSYTWANHDKFDLGLIEKACDTVGVVSSSWTFWQCQDAATVYKIVYSSKKERDEVKKKVTPLSHEYTKGKEHDPVFDSVLQTMLLLDCFNKINEYHHKLPF